MTRAFISYHGKDQPLLHDVSSILSSEGIDVVINDQIFAKNEMQSITLSAIKRCDAFIAILDENHSNVIFELGCAIGSGKTVLLIVGPKADLPFSLETLPAIRVGNSYQRFIADIIEWARLVTVSDHANNLPQGDPHNILMQFANDPSLLDAADSNFFESCITNLFKDLGVRFTRNDSNQELGFDFFTRDLPGHSITILEIKKVNWNSRVSINEVQRILGVSVAINASNAIIINSGHFTSSARHFAEAAPVKIVLLTLPELLDLSHMDIVARCS